MAADSGATSSLIGVSRPRIDSEGKVRGAVRFAADKPVRGLLHARVVPSLYAHARIRGMDGSAALAVPGVVAVISAADLPIVMKDEQRMFEPLARGEVVFVGQPVALVIAETPEAAVDAVPLVQVDYERLSPVIDLEAAMAPSSPPARVTPILDPADHGPADAKIAHAGVGAGGVELEHEELSSNVVDPKRYAEGDTTSGFAAAAAISSGRFRTNWVYQAYIEPHTATAWIEPDGTLAVESSTQAIFITRKELSRIYGLPLTKVRVSGAALGGAFGSKMLIVEPLVAGAVLRLRRPVRLALTRQEDMAATNPAPGCVMDVRIAADASGALTALDARLVFDTGGYPEFSSHGIAAVLIAGPYHWPAYDIRAYGVQTNRFPGSSYRAPGAPQAVFALESLVDELARQLDIDPIDLRRRNLVADGETMVDGEPWQHLGHREVLDAIEGHPLWRRRGQTKDGEGIGMALGYWPGIKEPAAAICRLNGDGTITVATGIVDMSGATSTFGVIAAEIFGLRPEDVDVVSLDTAGAPTSPGSFGSVVTYSAGLAVRDAALDARRQLLEYAALEMEIDPGDLEIVDGMVRPAGSPDRGRPVAEFADQLAEFGSSFPPVEGHASVAHDNLAPSCAAHLVRVRLDSETGNVSLLGLAVAQDVGRALNPALVAGQMQGGAGQGIGWALHEQLIHDDQGQLVTGSFLDYVVPRATHLPAIDTMIVEVPAPEGPFGAKGMAEASAIPGGAAVANAIAAAGGPRLKELPMTPRRVWEAINDRGVTT